MVGRRRRGGGRVGRRRTGRCRRRWRNRRCRCRRRARVLVLARGSRVRVVGVAEPLPRLGGGCLRGSRGRRRRRLRLRLRAGRRRSPRRGSRGLLAAGRGARRGRSGRGGGRRRRSRARGRCRGRCRHGRGRRSRDRLRRNARRGAAAGRCDRRPHRDELRGKRVPGDRGGPGRRALARSRQLRRLHDGVRDDRRRGHPHGVVSEMADQGSGQAHRRGDGTEPCRYRYEPRPASPHARAPFCRTTT